VPVLRTKKAEWTALRELTDDVRQVITPCLELLPREVTADTPEDRAHAVRDFAKSIRRNWGPRPILVDVLHLSSSVRHETVAVLARASEAYSISPIVVLSLFEESAVYAVARQSAAAGILHLALRVDYSELEKDDVSDQIDMTLDYLDTSPSEIHLLTDYGVTDAASPNYEWLAQRVPYMPSWREFVLLGGSFLRDLDGLAVGTRFHPRWDWFHWRSWASVIRHTRTPLPIYSDYAVQHAVYREPVEGSNPSASIRYASRDYWVIMRGEALWNRRTCESRHDQYFGNAQLLVAHDAFEGEHYSFGDHYISEVARRRTGPGTPTTWLAAATNHHVTLAARQAKEVAEEI
jgi:hypothetical protein